ncbi:hypothetical protein [Hymenobacter sp.]|uniref:hypothetical protein n=1 Tax=Hymenobacter sp. TaxID=1898978 RepID=UPI00286AEE03|nr:hypothetical protein [Hymenobacter sp.]
MMLEDLIHNLRARLLNGDNLAIVAYKFIRGKVDELALLDASGYTGNIESIAIEGFLGQNADDRKIKKIEKILDSGYYKKYINLYAMIGLHMQDYLVGSEYFGKYIARWFQEHSVGHKYLIAKFFSDSFEGKLVKLLESSIDSTGPLVLLLKHIYLEESVNVPRLLISFAEIENELDIIDLLVLEDLQSIQAIRYNKVQQALLNDIIWCASEIQSKHKVLNNKEDQYNSNFQSLLKAKGYKTEPQTQRGESLTQTSYGELDIAIFTENNLPLSIFEAFVIDSIEKDYITKHLVKLSENYDPNGLKNNYAVIYSKSNYFNDLWERYIDFVPTIDFEHEILKGSFEDITNQFPRFAGTKIGLTKHDNNKTLVYVYHIFMDMNF